MAITATTTVCGWRTTAGTTTVSLALDPDGRWRISISSGVGGTTLNADVLEADAIATAEQYAVLLEQAVVAEQAARRSRQAATSYINSTTVQRLANQPQ